MARSRRTTGAITKVSGSPTTGSCSAPSSSRSTRTSTSTRSSASSTGPPPTAARSRLYKIDMTKDGALQTNNWSDYEGLGISDDKIVFSAQQFTFNANQYQHQTLRILDRAAAYSGAALAPLDIVNFAAPPGGDANDNFVTKPARNLTAGDNTMS